MKFPKLFKKAAALVMAAVTTFSVLPADNRICCRRLARFPLTSLRTGMEMPCAITPVRV